MTLRLLFAVTQKPTGYNTNADDRVAYLNGQTLTRVSRGRTDGPWHYWIETPSGPKMRKAKSLPQALSALAMREASVGMDWAKHVRSAIWPSDEELHRK